MFMTVLQTVAESAFVGALVWAATTLKTTQAHLAPRLDANTSALDRNTEALTRRSEVGFKPDR